MRSFPTRALLASAGAASLLWITGAGPCWADHGGALRSPPMSPVVVAILAALLTLAACALFAVIVRILTRRTPPAE